MEQKKQKKKKKKGLSVQHTLFLLCASFEHEPCTTVVNFQLLEEEEPHKKWSESTNITKTPHKKTRIVRHNQVYPKNQTHATLWVILTAYTLPQLPSRLLFLGGSCEQNSPNKVASSLMPNFTLKHIDGTKKKKKGKKKISFYNIHTFIQLNVDFEGKLTLRW